DIVGWTDDDPQWRPRRRDPERVAACLSKCRCEPDRDYGTGDANCALYRAERRRPPRTVPTDTVGIRGLAGAAGQPQTAVVANPAGEGSTDVLGGHHGTGRPVGRVWARDPIPRGSRSAACSGIADPPGLGNGRNGRGGAGGKIRAGPLRARRGGTAHA